jgi:tetratricopeptide (TPR) repeat protein
LVIKKIVCNYYFADSNVQEAMASIHAALEMRLSGRADKALKLFEHAVALAPIHPDVLNHYGEFLEDTQKVHLLQLIINSKNEINNIRLPLPSNITLKLNASIMSPKTLVHTYIHT